MDLLLPHWKCYHVPSNGGVESISVNFEERPSVAAAVLEKSTWFEPIMSIIQSCVAN